MSALTPDEEAELAALTRGLFAPGAAVGSEAHARYAELETRKREARYAAPPRAEAEPPRAEAEPALRTTAVVPEPAVRPLTQVPAAEVASEGAAIVVPEPAAHPAESDQYAAIPEFGVLMHAAQDEQDAAAVQRAPVGSVVVESVSERSAASDSAKHVARSPRYSVKTRVLSAALGLGLAVLVGGGVAVARMVTAPQPIASGTAVAITLDELPDMGDLMSGAIEARTKAGGALYVVDGIPGLAVVLSSLAENDRCVYVAALENARPESYMSGCSNGYGPIVYDFIDVMLYDGPLPEESDFAGLKRLIIRDGEMTLWDDPTVRWEDLA